MPREYVEYVPFSEQVAVSSPEIAWRLLWHPYSLGTIYLVRGDHHKPFEKPGAHLFWAVKGQGTLETQNQLYSLEPGKKVWFVDMMHERTYTPLPNQRLIIRGIRFGGRLLASWHEQLCGGGRIEFALDDVSGFREAYWKIWKTVERKSAGWEWKTHQLLDQLLGALLASRHFRSLAHSDAPFPVARILAALAADPLKNWKAKDLVKTARTSYSNVRRLFLQAQKETLHHFILRRRHQQAKILLSNRDLSIKEVAETLDFSSQFYFSHFFNKWEGTSPSEFRKQLGSSSRAAIGLDSEGSAE